MIMNVIYTVITVSNLILVALSYRNKRYLKFIRDGYMIIILLILFKCFDAEQVKEHMTP